MSNITHKKRIFALALALAFVSGTQAQVFNIYSNGDEDTRNSSNGNLFGAEGFGNIHIGSGFNNSGGAEGFGNINIGNNSNNGGNAEGFGNQEISPIGSGLFLLAGMAGAYAFMRRRKDDQSDSEPKKRLNNTQINN